MITKSLIIVFFLIQLAYPRNSNIYSAEIDYLDSIEIASNKSHDTLTASVKNNQNEFEEVFLSFGYYGIVNKTLAVYYLGKFYLPFGEIFDELLLNYSIDRQKDIVRGFYIVPENEYEVNFQALTFRSSNNEFSFSNDDFIKKELEYYCSTDLLLRAFQLSFTVDIRNLTLNLASEDILPVYSKYLREIKYNYLSIKSAAEQFPLLFPREKFLLRGGFFDYAVSGIYAKHNQPFYNYSFGIGSELFGGDLETSIDGYSALQITSNSEFNYRWRYAFERNDFISHISIGNQVGEGLNSYTYEGVQISNQPLEQRNSFANFLISDQTTPGSTVELYINNQLVDYTRTDPAGNFSFWIPLTYGSSFVRLKLYDPNGSTRFVERYYQTPYNLNPPGEFNYTVNLGSLDRLNTTYFQTSGIFGVNNWLSNLIGIEYLDDDLFNKPIFYNSLTARISSSYLLNFLAAPRAFYQVSANAIYPSLTSINLSYTNYEKNILYNPTSIYNEITTNLNLPIYFDESPFNIQVNSTYQDNNSSELYDIRFGSSKNFGNFTPILAYNYRQFNSNNFESHQSNLSPGVIYSIGSFPSPFGFLRGVLINSGINYNISSSRLENYFLSFAANISSSLRLQFDHEHNIIFNVTNSRLHLFLELPFIRSYAGAGKNYFTASLTGSVLLNDAIGQFNFFNREQIGRAITSFRMFVDENGNGIFDAGEQPINDAKVNVQSLSSNISVGDEETQAKDLNPFTMYDVRVDESSLQNPMFTAKYRKFSFESGPNYIKNIEIPFYNSSEVSGYVYRILDSLKSPLPGIKVHVEGIDNDQKLTINTFSDGSFYYFGLRPGKFNIYLDQEQLKYLNCRCEPVETNITIEASGEGKSIENLNFELRTK